MLKRIYNFLQNKQHFGKYNIPKSWNYVNVNYGETENESEINVEPFCFFSECIKFILNYQDNFDNSGENMVIYSMLPRTFSARYDSGKCQTIDGTFLTSISLLPILKKLGINTICLLPIFQTSNSYKKGELGSPYSIKNIMQLDPLLHDELLTDFSVDDEFAAFVQACHCLGIKVMLDFVFRTVSRDSDLIYENPEWFYWIKAEEEANFKSPNIEGMNQCSVTKEVIKKLYSSNEIFNYIEKFAYPPEAELWKQTKIDAQLADTSIFDYWKKHHGTIVVPGFPDTINDPQPAWHDVTFPKFYFDNSPIINGLIDTSNFPPFIAQDGVKSSVGSGRQPNFKLWEYTKNIIPHYIDKFNIDGARIDMAHALPTKLNEEIIASAKNKKTDFILWSEEFNVKNSLNAKQEGYSFLTGGIWNIWDKAKTNEFNVLLQNNLNSHIPVLSCLEMPDTPRASYLFEDKYESLLFLSVLLNNTIILINNGQEFGEIQPMNLGLNNTLNGKFVLEKSNPLYGKLAFFDHYFFNWDVDSNSFSVIYRALQIHRKYFEFINKAVQNITSPSENVLQLTSVSSSGTLMAYFNFGTKKQKVSFNELPKNDVKIIFSKNFIDGNISENGFVISYAISSKERNI